MSRRADLQAAGDRALRLVNSTTRRFPRTSQAEPWRGVVTHYRRTLAERVAAWIKAGALLATLAGIGALLWRS
jgi:hypothetical protein